MVDAGGRGEAPATLPAPAGDHRDDGGTCWLTIAEGDEAQVVPLPNEGTLRIGRSDGCEIVLRNPLASRVHGEIKVGNGRITIRDLGSANGTRVGPLRIGPLVEHRLEPGTAAFIGTACLVAHELPGRERDASLVADSAAAIVWLRAWDARAIALARIRFAKRLSEPWVLRLVAQTLREGEVLIRSGAHEAWLVLACDGDRAARAAAEAATRRIHPWALAAGGEVHVVARQAGDDWERAVRRILEGCSPGANTQAGVVVGQESMRAVFNLVDRVAAGVISVLVLGETGVGKDVVATAIHSRSARRSGPFLRLNCAALSETLLESELFGFEAGAFTGARHAKPGLLEIAHGGTVFLDEAGELPLPLQAKLLRVLESREVMRIGGVTSRTLDVRFVSATNRDLGEAIRAGRFREDLFYRLAGVQIRVPSLRERRAEIEPLARLFAEQVAAQLGRTAPFRLSPGALARLDGHAWPGNVRELRNAIERAALLADGSVLEAHVFDLGSPEAAASPVAPLAVAAAAGPRVCHAGADADERERIEAALASCAGNQTRAAEILGIARRTLVKKLGRHRFPRPRKPPERS